MKIDRQDLKEMLIGEATIDFPDDIIEELANYLDELRSYREQDLVRRDDVGFYCSYFKCNFGNCDDCGYYVISKKRFDEIPSYKPGYENKES